MKLKPFVFCLKKIKWLLLPISRTRKLLRKSNIKSLKLVVGLLVISTCFITLLLYYWHRISLSEKRISRLRLKSTTTEKDTIEIPMKHVPFNEIYKNVTEQDKSDSLESDIMKNDYKRAQMLDTPGCKIPVAMIDYEKYIKHNKKSGNCGERAVFLKKVDGDKVQALIKPKLMKKYLSNGALFDCCYRFLLRHTRIGYENTKLKFTTCQKFQDGSTITLETDFVNIKCFYYDNQNTSFAIYDDVYAFSKVINTSKTSRNSCKHKYNVLIIGMDSMSLPRFVKTMPRTAAFFQQNYWLGFRGYHKIEDNTLPNLMAALTGKNFTNISKRCSGRMDQCHGLFIWNKFKKAGYVTAYGEDYLRLPDTFTKKYAFQVAPTDHYMRTFFLKGEREINRQSLVCAGKVPSGQQLLNYALDFANTYRRDSFFGLFWMNSFSHNENSRPQDADHIFENFFNQLSYTGVLRNTFIIFCSDHGIRFGEYRLKSESYYDERMPFLFIWTPLRFKGMHAAQFKSLAINQHRLITPYDLFNTFVDINRISACKNSTEGVSGGCTNCQSIFESISANRTCQDVAIPDKWCSCHKLFPLPVQDTEGAKSVQVVVSYIKSRIKSFKTKSCWGCMNISLKNIIRIHFYYNNDKVSLYYVIAFTMTPGDMSYEATVLRRGEKTELIGRVSVISPYRGLGHCTINYEDRIFCQCQKTGSC